MRVLRIYDELSAYNACFFLQEVIKALPFPIEAVRTDNGSEFTNGPFKREHPFTSLCARRGIKHILNPVAHPQSNGKVERSHRTDDEEFYRIVPAQKPEDWARQIRRWEKFYNCSRSHSALGKLTPYQRYRQFKKKEVKNVS
jgi:transposase InsO family protein